MHTIHDIVFEVDIQANNHMNSWEKYYVDFFQDQLLPRVEVIFDQWSAKFSNMDCSIDTLDIAVETNSLNLEELQKEIVQQITQQLQEIQLDGRSFDGTLIAEFTRKDSPFEALLSYLSSGILPKHISVKKFKEWLQTINEFSAEEKTKLTELLADDSQATLRLLSLLRNDYEKLFKVVKTAQQINSQYVQLQESFFLTFMQTMCKVLQISYSYEEAKIWYISLGKSSSLKQFVNTWVQLLTSKVQVENKQIVQKNTSQILKVLVQSIICYEVKKSIQISNTSIGITIHDISSPLSKKEDKIITKAVSSEEIVSKLAKDKIEDETKQKEENATQKNTESSNSIKKKTTSISSLKEIRNTSDSHANKTIKSLEENKQIKKYQSTRSMTNTLLTTEKSGLILLHPFLVTFLKGAELVSEENKITHIEKACVLLHYLATENEEVTDVELSLEKIMLGIPVETVINYEGALSDQDKKLCVELLEAVLQHWVVLKKSTINTLRDMFLKREGELKYTKDDIHLKVERAAQDILLEKIPWNISLIRLKWMEKIMHIEW
ncbi:contractile injection system tape measure protein [Kordia zhangzhouensis]|uniref:contractile injection system tape measure protein n=1 Tax=Kordia zhangzhouensis TaxID=1620405 RepID=UPI0006293CCB|nr:contractile injection system tape measure protein [Kordia zhangzhouensis]